MNRAVNHTLLITLTVVALNFALHSQQQGAATVGFKCDFPGSDPSHYAISVSSDGSASYTSDGKLARDADPGEPFTLDFKMPQGTVTRIFELAKKSHYFAGEIDSKKKNLASMGQKTLAYKDGQKNTSASYNYSPMPSIQELTSVFQNLSTTLEYGRRLEYDRRYQKLALDEELKQMSENRNELGDVSVIAPILKEIVDDPSVINGARVRAQRLLDQGTPSGK